ncbi:MAG: YwiC-like family protein [Candidatus Nitrospinota bacterium M3_3B_026]
MTLGKPVLPKEHGVWVTLLTPMFMGTFSAVPEDGFRLAAAALFAVSSLLGVFAMEPLRLFASPVRGVDPKRTAAWLGIYAIGAAVSFGAFVVLYDLWELLWLLAPAAILAGVRMWAGAARATRDLKVELIGVLGLCLTAPAASFIQTGVLGARGLFLYALCVIWFTDRLMSARRTLERVRSRPSLPSALDRAAWHGRQLAVHIAALVMAALVIFFSGGSAPAAAFFPFLLATAKNVLDVGFLENLPGPMRIGFAEMGLGIAFGLAQTAAWLFV